MSKKHSEIFKLDTIHQYKAGISTAQLCKQVGIARSTLLLWVKQYSVNADGEVPRERYLLEKELEHLRTENAIFKTCGCSLSSPLSKRLSAIHRYKDKFSIHALCRVLNVNRSTYYHYALRSPEKTQIQLQDCYDNELLLHLLLRDEPDSVHCHLSKGKQAQASEKNGHL